MAKLGMLLGFGAGYVLGARAGRERYDELKAKAKGAWRDPRVQRRASQARHVVQDKAVQAQESVRDTIKDRLPGGDDDSHGGAVGIPGETPGGSSTTSGPRP